MASSTGLTGIIDVDGVLSEHYTCVAASPCALLVVVPGNPGMIDFYVHFVDLLFSALEERATVLVVNHAGHCSPTLTYSRLFSLEEQIKHKCALLHGLLDGQYPQLYYPDCSAPHSSPIVLVGHSIGSYIALKTLHACPQLPIAHVINLFPTIRHIYRGFAPTVKFLTLWGVRHAASTLAHYFGAMIASVAMEAPVRERFGTTLVPKLHYHSALNILHLANIEGQTLHDLDDEIKSVCFRHGKALLFIYGYTDRYTPLDFPTALKEEFPNCHVHMSEDRAVEHAFCIEHSEPIVRQVVSWLHAHSPDLFSSSPTNL